MCALQILLSPVVTLHSRMHVLCNFFCLGASAYIGQMCFLCMSESWYRDGHLLCIEKTLPWGLQFLWHLQPFFNVTAPNDVRLCSHRSESPSAVPLFKLEQLRSLKDEDGVPSVPNPRSASILSRSIRLFRCAACWTKRSSWASRLCLRRTRSRGATSVQR